MGRHPSRRTAKRAIITAHAQGISHVADKKHLVCLTFDFDTVSIWLAQGRTSPTFISRGELGVVGAERLISLFERMDLSTTWFIPGLTIDTYPDACRAVADAGHEVGHHGYDHVTPRSLERAEEADQLARGNAAIETIAGKPARGYRSPAWDLSDHSADLLLEAGFVYDSSLMGHDYLPYQVRRGDVVEVGKPVRFGEDTPLIELPVSWSLDDYPHFEPTRSGGLMNAEAVFDNWFNDFVFMRDEYDFGVMTTTCHPFVIGRGHRMRAFERFIERIRDEGAVFVTCEEACAEYAARTRAQTTRATGG